MKLICKLLHILYYLYIFTETIHSVKFLSDFESFLLQVYKMIINLRILTRRYVSHRASAKRA